MQIRPVSSFAALAIAPPHARAGRDGINSTPGASVGPDPANSTASSTQGEASDGVQRSADGDTYTPGRNGSPRPSATRERGELSKQDQAEVRELQARDTEVRAHENAHKAAAGGLARGGPNYEYQTGPDGKRYAVGGDVQIDTSPGKTPEETIAKAERIRSAGLAPAQPSGADRAVVAEAAQMEAAARAERASKNADGDVSEVSGGGRASSDERRPRLDLVA